MRNRVYGICADCGHCGKLRWVKKPDGTGYHYRPFAHNFESNFKCQEGHKKEAICPQEQ